MTLIFATVMKKIKAMSLIILLIAGAMACEKILPKAPPDDELLDGPIEGLTNGQTAIFPSVDIAFND